MWCNNCGRKQPSYAPYCAHCGEPKASFAQTKPNKLDHVFAKDLRLKSMTYYFMILAGLLLVVTEIAGVAIRAVSVVQLIMQDAVGMEQYYSALALQEPFVSMFSLIERLVVLFLGGSIVAAGFFTVPRLRKILSFVSGGLILLWLMFDLFGLPAAMGTDLATGVMLFSIPLVAGYVYHPFFMRSAINTIIGVAVAFVLMLLLPSIIKALMMMVLGIIGFGEFGALCDPFMAIVTLAVPVVAHCSAISRISAFLSQIPDTCHPKHVKRVGKPRPPQGGPRGNAPRAATAPRNVAPPARPTAQQPPMGYPAAPPAPQRSPQNNVPRPTAPPPSPYSQSTQPRNPRR